MVPVAGSAYTYAYATLGELVAWIIGWDLIIEYAVGNVAVAISWSAYFQELLARPRPARPGVAGHGLPHGRAGRADAGRGGRQPRLRSAARCARARSALQTAPHVVGIPVIFNLPAFLIVMLVTWVLVRGISESAWFNSAMVVLKLVIIAFFLVMGAFYVKPENWTPFAPNGWAGISERRRDHLLRLHRVRRRLDRGGGDQEPAARHADRHHGQPGRLHGDLHRRGAGAHRACCRTRS